jgi:sarcosine oxidase gamma subunit
VVRVPAELLDGVAVGVTAVLTVGDEATPLTVRSVGRSTAAEALARTGTGTVLVAVSGPGFWHVVVADRHRPGP